MTFINFTSLQRHICILLLCFGCHHAFAQIQDSLKTETDTITGTQKVTRKPKAFIIGCISSKTILQKMPQYKAVQSNMNALREQYEAEAQKSEHDFQQKFEEFMQGQKDFHKTILEKRQNELQNMLETNASFRLKVQKLLAEAEKEMTANVMTEMNEAINVAAEERGISIVFDTDGDSVPYMVKGLAVDLTNSVLSILGIEK